MCGAGIAGFAVSCCELGIGNRDCCDHMIECAVRSMERQVPVSVWYYASTCTCRYVCTSYVNGLMFVFDEVFGKWTNGNWEGYLVVW